MDQRVTLRHPDGHTISVPEPRARVLRRQGWEDTKRPRRRSATTTPPDPRTTVQED